MRKNYNFLLLVLTAAIGLTACKKDRDDEKNFTEKIEAGLEVNATGKPYLVSKIVSSDKDYLTASYDNKGRLTRYEMFEDGVSETQSNLVYKGNTVILENIVDGDKSSVTVTLGSNGYAKEAVETNVLKDGIYTTTVKGTGKITQNSEGYLIKLASTTVETSNDPTVQPSSYTTTSDYTYSGGNLTRSVLKFEGLVYTETYEYYNDKPYVPFIFDTYASFLLGKPSTNLIKKVTVTFESSGQTNSESSSYTYTYDSAGLPISVTDDSGEKVSIQYIAK